MSGAPWTEPEDALIKANWHRGCRWCRDRLPGRTTLAVYRRARVISASRPIAELRRPTTPQIDAAIIRAYQSGQPNGFLARLSRATGRSTTWLGRRASALGYTRTLDAGRPWSDEEIAFADTLGHLSARTVSRMMRDKGWRRSEGAVTSRRTRRGLETAPIGYHNAAAFAHAIGVNRQSVTNWIKAGLLVATRRDPQSDFLSERYLLTERDIACFIVKHPTRVDLRKVVDGPWLLDIVARYGSLGLIEPRDKGERIVALDALGKSPAEIAVILDTTPNAVSVTLSKHRGRARKGAVA